MPPGQQILSSEHSVRHPLRQLQDKSLYLEEEYWHLVMHSSVQPPVKTNVLTRINDRDCPTRRLIVDVPAAATQGSTHKLRRG